MLKESLYRSKGRLFYAVVQVPLELQEIVGKTRITKSLSTSNPDEASRLLSIAMRDVRQAVLELFEILTREAKEAVVSGTGPAPFDLKLIPPKKPYSKEVQSALAKVRLLSSENILRIEKSEADLVAREADRIIDELKLPIEIGTSQYWKLCIALKRIQRDAFQNAPAKQKAMSGKNGADDRAKRNERLNKATLAEVVARYREEFSRQWSTQRETVNALHFKYMLDLLGPLTPVRQLNRNDFREARDLLEDLSPVWSWYAATKNLPVREAAQICRQLDLSRRSIASVNKTLRMFRSVMSYAEAEGYVDQNRASNLYLRAPDHESQKVLPFDKSRLNKFFQGGPVYFRPPPIEDREARFWVPLIALWTGMRMGEIAQLDVTDITVEEYIPLIHVAPIKKSDLTGRKYVKTPYSRRTIPIHPVLQQIGLLEHWRRGTEAGTDKLFPELKRNHYTLKYDLFVQQMLHDLTVSGVRTPGYSFRSFRHNFRDALREADVADDSVRRLGGWARRSIADGYGIGPSNRQLYRSICKIDYDGVSFTQLQLYPVKYEALQ